MRCGRCGLDNPEAARVCRGCAELLDGPTVNLPSLPDSPYIRRSRRLTGLIVLALVGLTLFTCLMVIFIGIPR